MYKFILNGISFINKNKNELPKRFDISKLKYLMAIMRFVVTKS